MMNGLVDDWCDQIGDQVSDVFAGRYGVRSRASGVRFPRPLHYYHESDEGRISQATGIRGKHISWREPGLGPGVDADLIDALFPRPERDSGMGPAHSAIRIMSQYRYDPTWY